MGGRGKHSLRPSGDQSTGEANHYEGENVLRDKKEEKGKRKQKRTGHRGETIKGGIEEQC